MNKPMTISSLFFANAFFCASLCVAQAETSEASDPSAMPAQQQQDTGGSPSDPDGDGQPQQGAQDTEPQEESLLSDPDGATGLSLSVNDQDDYLTAEITLQDEEAGFIAAVLVSTSDSYMDIGGEAVLRGGKLVAIGMGSGSSFEMPLPQELNNLSVELYMQALILDADGQLHIGPITRLSDQLRDSEQQADA